MNKSPRIRLKKVEQMLLMKRLALYVRSGVSLPRALHFISEQTTKTGHAFLYTSIEESITNGNALSHGLSLFPHTFTAFTIGFIRAGEQSGNLPETFERLAEMFQKKQLLERKVRNALLYPGIILFGTGAILLFLTIYIFPKILPVLQGLHTALPLSTRILIGINSLLLHQWILLSVCIVLCAICITIASRFYSVQKRVEQHISRIPLFGTLYTNYSLSLLLRTLSLL